MEMVVGRVVRRVGRRVKWILSDQQALKTDSPPALQQHRAVRYNELFIITVRYKELFIMNNCSL